MVRAAAIALEPIVHRAVGGGVQPRTNNVGLLHCAAARPSAGATKPARPLTSSRRPARSVLRCSQNCTFGAVVALFSCQPTAGTRGFSAQFRGRGGDPRGRHRAATTAGEPLRRRRGIRAGRPGIPARLTQQAVRTGPARCNLSPPSFMSTPGSRRRSTPTPLSAIPTTSIGSWVCSAGATSSCPTAHLARHRLRRGPA